MSSFNKVLFLFSFVCVIQSCMPPSGTNTNNVNIDLQEAKVQDLIKLKNSGMLDSLISLFDDSDPTVRFLAISSMASFKDKKATTKLIDKLSDPILEVRAAAAFALGQIKDPDSEGALISAFISQDTMSIDNIFNGNILEALGKLGLEKTALNISSVKTYRAADTKLMEGQMKSIYQFGLRDIVLPESVEASITVLENNQVSKNAKLYAAHFLGRSKVEFTDGNISEISFIFDAEEDADIKMGLANSFSKLSSEEGPNYIYHKIKSEEDYRVKCNLIRSLGKIDGGMFYVDSIAVMLSDPNLHIAKTAVSYLNKSENIKTLPKLYELLKDKKIHWSVRAKIYESIFGLTSLRFTNTKRIVTDSIMALMEGTDDIYAKRAYINAIGADVFNFQRLMDYDPSNKVLKTAKVDALAKILNNEDFFTAYRSNAINVKKEIVNHIADMCVGGNAGVISTASYLLADPGTLTKELIEDSLWIDKVYDGMTLPQDLEAFMEFSKVEKVVTDEQRKPVLDKYYSNVDQAILNQLNDSSLIVLKTTQGNISIKVEEKVAPTTVASFVRLCNEDYYDDKVFHRVVPNFVVQVGCPDGDGYGSGDFLLRSEFSQLAYDKEGIVGMASIGSDTESNQFFITHSATPHLDGKYTVFGRVVKGMDVVHKLQVGDKIIDAILTK